MTPPIIQLINLYYFPIQSLEEVKAYQGQLVEFTSSDNLSIHKGVDTIFGDNKHYAYVGYTSKETPEGEEAIDFHLFSNANDAASNHLLTDRKLANANLRFRLLNVYEVEEVKNLIDSHQAKFTVDDNENRILQHVINRNLHRLNVYRHFDQHPTFFQGSMGFAVNLPEQSKLIEKVEKVLDQVPIHLAALVGMTGTGKTYLAKQFMYSARNKYIFCAYFNAESEETLYADYMKLADQHDIDYPRDVSKDEQMLYIKSWLEARIDSLFVYDNMMDQSLIDKYVPTGKNRVLLISKDPAILSRSRTIPLQALSMDDAKVLIKEINPNIQDDSDIEQLIMLLGNLPLALTQAATFMAKNSLSCKSYLSHLIDPRYLIKLLSYDHFYDNHEHKPVWTTFDADFKIIEEQNPQALLLLQRLSSLSAEWVSRDSLENLIGANAGQKPIDDLALIDMTAILNQHSLLEFSSDLNKIKVNPLLKNIVRHKYSRVDEANHTLPQESPAIAVNTNTFFAKMPAVPENLEVHDAPVVCSDVMKSSRM